jgi:hypothetical protein
MRPTVVLFLWWRSRIFVYRKSSSSTRCATSTFLNGVHTASQVASVAVADATCHLNLGAAAEEEHADERNYCFLRSPDCAVHDPAALQDVQTETADRRPIRITKNVPILRPDHTSTKSTLLGVWQVSLLAMKCDPDFRKTERRLSPRTASP